MSIGRKKTMDKQKQIEEMAKLLDGYWSTKSKCPFDKKCPYLGGSVRFTCNDCLRAYTIYNAGYRKIPENAVVLTREELERHKGFSREEVDEISETAIKNSRKETAEKFAERVKMAFYYEFDELIPSIMADKIDEICKELVDE